MSDAAAATPSAPTAPAVPHNVPPALSSFVGRARERADLARALGGAGGTRLVTITGPGGAGKTRLAREVAAAGAASRDDGRPPFPGGVWWVELAPVSDPSAVAPAIGDALGVRPAPGRDVLDAVAEVLRGVGPASSGDDGPRTLLVLDNCEHVVEAAAMLVERLLRAVPSLAMLATSREALAVEGEQVRVLPPLASPPTTTPTAAAIAHYEAVRLFVERAQAASPAFALSDASAPAVATITARLDGLPLALELAAASVGALGVEQVAARLDDAFRLLTRGRRTALPRHRTLQALLDWSYELLRPAERALLARLAVFRGPFTADAVEAVGAAGHGDAIPDGAAAVAALGRLVEQSLVEARDHHGETRFRLLETVKQYGLDRLGADPDEARRTHARHARWVEALASAAAPATWSAARGRTVARLARDVDEIRGALDWALGAEPMLAARIVGALAWFWISGVSWQDARGRVEAALAAADAEGVSDAARSPADQRALAELLFPLSALQWFAGESAPMLRTAERAETLWSAVAAGGTDDALRAARGRAMMRQQRGLALAALGRVDESRRAADDAVCIAGESGDAWLDAVMRCRRPYIGRLGGAYDRAPAEYADAIARLRAVGETWLLSRSLYEKGEMELAAEDLAAAAASMRESVAVLHDEPDAWFLSCALDTLATIAVTSSSAARGNAAAARLLGAAAELRARCGAEVIEAERGRHAATVAQVRATLPRATFDAEWAAGAALDLDGLFALARDADVLDADVTGAERSVRAPEAAPPAASGPASPAVAPLAVRVLGPLVVARDGVPLGAGELPGGKVSELLLYLVCHPEGRTKEEIGLALWPDASAAQVRGVFHVTLHRLRRAIGGERGWVTVVDGRYALAREPAPGVRLACDVDDLLAAADALARAERRQQALDAAALADAERALGVGADGGPRGDLAPGLALGDWIVEHQDRVRAAWADGVQALGRQHARVGRAAEGARVLGALVTREPLRESAHRELMVLWAASGERARALAHYDALVTLLRREVGVPPSRDTQGIAERIRLG
ncbi:transcriptional activator domain-containing protein (plasmid) [Gemmatirosa kalamazoonensis]|uniref:Transcriptional activator domain-containing protein n=1 Tax=Gemmatirosa kalamazoonensis TaxID=861299 RepID=W0RR27_9BACT|nr:BTAD domain-containing putative transcriptional regulator [Gemmatirosa kalamazoonensis]AHG93439.1 transcriptional activator domain-containing protein [Gemmatirosa kalamazoonensis]